MNVQLQQLSKQVRPPDGLLDKGREGSICTVKSQATRTALRRVVETEIGFQKRKETRTSIGLLRGLGEGISPSPYQYLRRN